MDRRKLHLSFPARSPNKTPSIASSRRRTMRHALLPATVVASIFSLLGGPASAHDLVANWQSFEESNRLIGVPKEAIQEGITWDVWFDVPPRAVAGPVKRHGADHVYTYTALTGFRITGSDGPNKTFSGSISVFHPYGLVNSPGLDNQPWTIRAADLAWIPPNGVIGEVHAFGQHVYVVPEPETYALLLAGLAALAWRVRGRGASKD